MRKILLIQLRQLGDIILTTPCIRELRAAYPDAQIDFLAHGMGRLILNDNPYLNEIITYSENDSLKKQFSLIRRLRKENYELVLDFMYNPRSALLAFLTGAKRRLAFPSRRKAFYNELVTQPSEPDYIVREKFKYLEHLNVPTKSEALTLPWFEAHLGPYQENRKALFPNDKSFRIALSPTHRRDVRQWPKKQYAMLADYLTSQWNAEIIWLWGPGEQDFVEEVKSHCKESSKLSPKTSFRELAALLANCDLFVGNSNGPSHVAVSCQTPSLQLHGPTFAKAWCPMNEIHHAIQADKMAEISLDQVIQSLEAIKPVVEKRVEARLENGDRISWNS